MDCRVLAGLVALALAPTAHADDVGTQALAPVVVPLPPETAPDSPTDRDPTGMVTLIPVAQRRTEVQRVSELLALAPSVQLREASGIGQSEQLTLRGASSLGVRVMLDGIPLAGAGGIADLSLVPLALVDSIEVARGPAGARYGGGALGGVINLVTVPTTRGARIAAQLTGGSFGSALGQLDASGPLLGGEALLLVHGERSEGDFDFPQALTPAVPDGPVVTRTRANNQAGLGGALAKYRRRLGAYELSVLADALEVSRGLAGTAQNPTPSAHEDTWRALGSVRLLRDFDSGASVSGRVYATREHSVFTSGVPGESAQTLTTTGAEALARVPWGVQSFTATLEAGTDALSAAKSPSWGRLAAMLVDNALLFEQRLALSGSVRVDRAGPFVGVSPKLGATLFLPSGLELHANLGQTFRPPSFLELYVPQGTVMPNAALTPETARTADVALVRVTSRGRASLGGYLSEYQDLISYELYAPFLARPYNFAGARAFGLELEGSLAPISWLSLDGSYTLTGSQNLRDDPRYLGKRLPYLPTHRLGARVDAGPSAWHAFAALLYTSSQFTNRAQTLSIPAAARLDLGATFRLARVPRLSATLELRNLTDVHTFGFDGYPLPGRAAFATIAVALGEPSQSPDRNTP